MLQFVLTARSIGEKLRAAGYWADFINPFSGKPYLHPHLNYELGDIGDKLSCLDFQILEMNNNCTVISSNKSKGSKKFVGKYKMCGLHDGLFIHL